MTAPIDAARLRAAVAYWKQNGRCEGIKLLLAAANAYLATLPKPVVFEVQACRDHEDAWTRRDVVSTRDAAARTAARMIEEGCNRVLVTERTP